MSRKRANKSALDEVAESFEQLPARVGLITAKFAEGKRYELIDGDDLRRLIAEAKGHIPQAPSAVSEACPQCGGALERKLARRGKNAGTHFLGCSRFPNCRYARSF